MLTGLIGLVWAVYGHFTQWLSVAFLKAELFLTCHAAFETLSWHTVCMTLQLICIKWNSAQLCRISKGCCHLCCPNSKLSVKMNDMMFNRGVTSLTSVIDLLLFQISSKYIYPSIHPYYIYILGVARYMYSYRTVTVRTSRFGAWCLTTNTGNSPPIPQQCNAVW